MHYKAKCLPLARKHVCKRHVFIHLKKERRTDKKKKKKEDKVRPQIKRCTTNIFVVVVLTVSGIWPDVFT